MLARACIYTILFILVLELSSSQQSMCTLAGGSLDSTERGTVEWNSGTMEWNSKVLCEIPVGVLLSNRH